MYVCVYAWTQYECICVYATCNQYVHVCMCVCVGMYVCMCVCVCMYVCMYVWTHALYLCALQTAYSVCIYV